MIYKPQYMVNMESGAMLDLLLLPEDQTDRQSIAGRIVKAKRRVAAMIRQKFMDNPLETLINVCDYDSTIAINEQSEIIPSVNIPELNMNWDLDNHQEEQRDLVLTARERIASDEGRQPLRKSDMHVTHKIPHFPDDGCSRGATRRREERIRRLDKIATFGKYLSILKIVLFGCGTLKQLMTGVKSARILLLSGILTLMAAMVGPEGFQLRLSSAALSYLDI